LGSITWGSVAEEGRIPCWGSPVADRHTETYQAAELTLTGYGPDKPTRLVVATSDPATLPAENTWYLATNLPRSGAAQAPEEQVVEMTSDGTVSFEGYGVAVVTNAASAPFRSSSRP
jgi:hypothetical protein